AACRAAGAIRLSTPGEVVELAGFFASSWLPAARRIAIVSDSGGQGAIAADTAGGFGLSVYSSLVDELLADETIDAVVLSGYFGCYGEDIPELLETELAEVDRLGHIVSGHRKPLIVHSMSADSQAVAGLWERGIPSYASIEAAM